MELTDGTLLGGRLRYVQPARGWRTGIEPVLLAAWPDGDRRSRLVFIVRDLSREAVLDGLRTFEQAAA